MYMKLKMTMTMKMKMKINESKIENVINNETRNGI